MTKPVFYLSIAGVAAIILAIGFALLPATPAEVQATPKVAATVFPLYDIARNVGEGVVEVQLILPANAEPHTYEPTPSAMKAIAASRAVYAIGHRLDDWVLPLANAGQAPVVTVDAGIALRPLTGDADEPTDGYDPHYWMSIANAKIIAANVAADLTARFPDRAAAIAANVAAYESRLDDAERQVHLVLDGLKDRRLATFHGAFGYFAAAYGLEIAAVFEEFPGQEPTPRYLAELQQTVKAKGLKVIYHEPAFNAAALDAFATENGLALGTLDDLGGSADRASLIATLLYDAQSIASHQR